VTDSRTFSCSDGAADLAGSWGRVPAGQRRRRLYGLLGALPPRRRAIGAKSLSLECRAGLTLEKLELDLNGRQPVPAWYLRPADAAALPAPAVLYCHYHAGRYDLGKDEFLLAKPEAGLPSWAESLAAGGYAALCIDAWGFGERSGRSELDLFKEAIWQGQSLWGLMVYDALRALDYLAGRPEVNPRRLAALGMSMGSTMAWWLAALDRRIKVCVDICCLTDYEAWSQSGDLSGHGIYYFVPGLRKRFTTAGINALIAPRAHLGLAGIRDPLTPPTGLDRIERELGEVYRRAGHPDRWRLSRYDVGHEETAAMRVEALAFLKTHL